MHKTLERIRGEFLEMPGLRLTVAQAQRLCGIDRVVCQGVLDALVDANFLCIRADGTYTRATDGEPPRARLAKAELVVPKRVAS